MLKLHALVELFPKPGIFSSNLINSAIFTYYKSNKKSLVASGKSCISIVHSNSTTPVREQLHHGEDTVKTDSHMAGTEVLSQSCLIHKEAQHLHKDCQGVSINVDSGDLCSAVTTAGQEPERSQPSLKQAIQNVPHPPQFDLLANSSGIISHLDFTV